MSLYGKDAHKRVHDGSGGRDEAARHGGAHVVGADGCNPCGAGSYRAQVRHADTLHWYEAHERAYNKLARTYVAQVEALRKHRNGGKQTVTVQHVNVAKGGQAIVGNVETGGRGKNEK